MLLAGLPAEIWADQAVIDENRQLALALVSLSPFPADPAANALVKETEAAFSGEMPDTSSVSEMMMMLDDGRQAAAILSALRLLSLGAHSDPVDIRGGLFTLVEAGQPAAARKIAVQILLLSDHV